PREQVRPREAVQAHDGSHPGPVRPEGLDVDDDEREDRGERPRGLRAACSPPSREAPAKPSAGSLPGIGVSGPCASLFTEHESLNRGRLYSIWNDESTRWKGGRDPR